MAQASRLCGGRVTPLAPYGWLFWPWTAWFYKAVERLLRTRRALGKIAARPQLSGGSGVGIESACQLTIYIYIYTYIYIYRYVLTNKYLAPSSSVTSKRRHLWHAPVVPSRWDLDGPRFQGGKPSKNGDLMVIFMGFQ